MNVRELIELFAEGLEVAPETLTPATEIASVEEWNSLGWLSIMSLLDERLGIQIGSRDTATFKTVADVVAYVRAKSPIED